MSNCSFTGLQEQYMVESQVRIFCVNRGHLKIGDRPGKPASHPRV